MTLISENVLNDMPVLPLRNVVVFPSMVVPLFVGREKSVSALNLANENAEQIFLAAQKDPTEDNPSTEDIYDIGTVATVMQMLKMPDGTIKVLVEGQQRAKVRRYSEMNPDDSHCYVADIEILDDEPLEDLQTDALQSTLVSEFEAYAKNNSKIPAEVVTAIKDGAELTKIVDSIAGQLEIKNNEKQVILELTDVGARVEYVLGIMTAELDKLRLEKKIRSRVKQQMEKSQREYYLNEQIKAIQKELGDADDATGDIEELAEKIATLGLSAEAKSKGEAELKKLKMMSPMSAEATVVRNYLDWLVALPWKKQTRVSRDLNRAQEILDTDHYGLDKVKERILEHLAVQQRVKKPKAAILCLVGPPGVGKTSLGQSIARATNRKFVRISLGGVRDEAEIRGHRRTYIGSMPGKIVQNLAKVKTGNPLFMLDEIDKMSTDFRGDPSSALLEVLDPEQNHSFGDHYLEVDYDLSNVMFIATANTLNIPGPLLDRMEVIRISGYTDEEKLEIANRYLIPKQKKNNGIKDKEVSVGKGVIEDVLKYYTREAGVRGLEREISKIFRKVVKTIIMGSSKKVAVTQKTLDKYLGVKRFRKNKVEESNRIGAVNGLAWTQVGGELLDIECTLMPGKGKQIYTGKLGDVMKESITAAVSVVRNRAHGWGIDDKFYQQRDMHIHVPDGATPKDGPSAGIGMCTALVSALTGIEVKTSVAMTGEITLRGEVLPIGGLKEKLLAAVQAGVKTVLIPDENTRDLAEIPETVSKELTIIPVRTIDEVIEHALVKAPTPLSDGSSVAAGGKDSSSELTAH